MTLRQLLQSVDASHFTGNALYRHLLATPPEYGNTMPIGVAPSPCGIIVTNVHIGTLGDLLMRTVDLSPQLQLTPDELLTAILDELARDGYTDADSALFWDEMTDLQKGKIVR